MLATIRDERGHLQAACDWWCVNIRGEWDALGSWVYVNQLELSPGVNSARMIRLIIQDIASLVPWVVGAYWERADKTQEKLHSYSLSRLSQQVEKEVRVG